MRVSPTSSRRVVLCFASRRLSKANSRWRAGLRELDSSVTHAPLIDGTDTSPLLYPSARRGLPVFTRPLSSFAPTATAPQSQGGGTKRKNLASIVGR